MAVMELLGSVSISIREGQVRALIVDRKPMDPRALPDLDITIDAHGLGQVVYFTSDAGVVPVDHVPTEHGCSSAVTGAHTT